ncbi:UNVERIFIED_CONTAM: hypothetical protein Sindi_0722700 [Sesamum indicum]
METLSTNEKGENLTTDSTRSKAPQKLGFEEASINGGRMEEPFNLDEFLRLANAVIDKGDEQTVAALTDLKIRWRMHFRNSPSLRSVVELHGGGAPPRRQAWRCILPSGKSNMTSETASKWTGSDLQAPATKQPHFFAGKRMTYADDITVEASMTYIADITAEASMIPSPADVTDDITLHAKTKNLHPNLNSSAPMGLFDRNIPLHACPDTIIDDKIAHVFHNSTRKTLSYVALSVQNGEVIVRPTLDIIRNGSKRWKTTAVGYFLRKRPYFHHLKEIAMSVWPELKEVTGTNNGFFFLQFKSVAAMEDVIEGGPWLFQGQPIVLQKWEPGMVLRKLQHTQVPLWIKLRHLPVEFWTEERLSTVASGVGKPLYPDAITRACTRLDFARVCVMVDVTSNLPKHIIIMNPDEDGGESPCKVNVEYEWLPQKCKSCMTLGHSVKDCVLNKPKPAKPPIAVYVPKVGTLQEPTRPERNRSHPREEEDTTNIPSRPLHMIDRNKSRPPPAPVVEKKREGREYTRDTTGPSREERGKALVIYNTFDALHLLDDTDESSRGPKHSSPIPSDPFAVTVTYGATEVVDRRELWSALGNLAIQCVDIPWLIGGDFNDVRDLSEVCGTSGDIRTAMEEFNAAIQNTGLLPLPMQGEWYTWHNHSATPQNLWKRLDRMLINDRWMARFPNAFYSVLTPRTSDHSPIVLYEDRQQQYGGMFRFDNYLARLPELIPSVQNIWQHNILGTPMYALTRKLKALKPISQEQRRNKGDVSHNVQMAKGYHEAAQLLVSSRRRDELYIQLEHCCRLVLAKWMKGGDQCSREFFRKIAQRRSTRRIFQINDDQGSTHTDPEEVINEFVTYYQNLLGGDRRRTGVDIRTLRPWARHILSNEESTTLLLPFTPADVKQAVFDIDEDKAPGPDGYSSGFFKAAWPIVGQEVTSAVLDFFSTGRLLKQINTTFLALIPKVHSPMTVSEFRPIACCNVIYKIIRNLIVQRLSVIMDKLISPCQAAFVPGRSIGDNIMLAQELFTGYNQTCLPPRCALKVDIRKAYDTVDWDFLSHGDVWVP